MRKASAVLTLFTSSLAPAAIRAAEAPSAVYDPASSNGLVVFVQGCGGLCTNYWNGSKWEWQSQGSPLGVTVDPSNSLVYQPSSHPLVDFTNDASGNVLIDYWNGAKWVWQDLGNPGVPVVSSDALYDPSTHELIGFVHEAVSGHLYDVYWNGSKWVWQDQGHPPGTTEAWPPGGAYYDPTSHLIVAFVVAQNGHLFEKYSTGNGNKWTCGDLGSPPHTWAIDAPAAVIETLAPYHDEIFVVGHNGHLFEANGKAWHDLGTPPGSFVDSYPSAVYQPTSHPYTVFVMGANAHLYDVYYNSLSSSWTWEDQGTPPSEPLSINTVSAVYGPTPAGMNVLVFGTGWFTGDLYVKYWDGTKGWRWQNLGGS